MDDAKEMCATRKAFSLIGDSCELHAIHLHLLYVCIVVSRFIYKIDDHFCINYFFIIGISENDQMASYQILTAILHLSNVEVTYRSDDKSTVLVEYRF